MGFQGGIYIQQLADIMQQTYLNQVNDSANISDSVVNIFQGGKFIFNGKTTGNIKLSDVLVSNIEAILREKGKMS